MVNEAYENIKDYIPTDSPFTVAENGLNDFCDDLADVIPNSQTQQNVYAEAWIGKLFPGFHFGAGVNAGVSALDVSTLKDAALALGVDDVKDINDTLVFPTITVDARLGGIILPFDIGVTAMSIDTSRWIQLTKLLILLQSTSLLLEQTSAMRFFRADSCVQNGQLELDSITQRAELM